MQKRILCFVNVREKNELGEEMRNSLTTLGLGAQILIQFALLGCSARTPANESARTGCELDLSVVCARAIEHYAAGEAVHSTQRESSNGAHLVPLSVPVALTGRDMTADVDCYVSIESDKP